jgi:hypothetical protein
MVCKNHGRTCNSDCIDPNIDNGMMTKIWGPPGWLFLHCVTFGYPYKINEAKEEHIIRREQTRQFFRNIGYVLPCKYCRLSYQEFIKKTPVEDFLNSRRDLTLWLYKIHNDVNHKLGVPDCNIPTFEEVQKTYEAFRAKCSKTTESEREANKAKGCIKPADGTTKRCFLKVVTCKSGDITRRDNKELYYTQNRNDYILIKKEHLIACIIIAVVVLLCIWFRDRLGVWIKKLINISKKRVKLRGKR